MRSSSHEEQDEPRRRHVSRVDEGHGPLRQGGGVRGEKRSQEARKRREAIARAAEALLDKLPESDRARLFANLEEAANRRDADLIGHPLRSDEVDDLLEERLAEQKRGETGRSARKPAPPTSDQVTETAPPDL